MPAKSTQVAINAGFSKVAMGTTMLIHMKQAGMTQECLAKQVGLTAPTLSRGLRGISGFNVFEADDIARALGMNIDVLVGDAKTIQSSGVADQVSAAQGQLSTARARARKLLAPGNDAS